MEDRPEPELIKTKDGWHVTDGWIGDAFFRVIKQPSNETIIKLHQFWVETSRKG